MATYQHFHEPRFAHLSSGADKACLTLSEAVVGLGYGFLEVQSPRAPSRAPEPRSHWSTPVTVARLLASGQNHTASENFLGQDDELALPSLGVEVGKNPPASHALPTLPGSCRGLWGAQLGAHSRS